MRSERLRIVFGDAGTLAEYPDGGGHWNGVLQYLLGFRALGHDVLLFDDLFLHRTAADPTMPRRRYAIETWFFAPSAYPEGQIPLVF